MIKKLKLITDKRSRKANANDPLIKKHVYKYCLRNSECQHERLLKRKNTKSKRTIFAKRLKKTRRKLWKTYDKNEIR